MKYEKIGKGKIRLVWSCYDMATCEQCEMFAGKSRWVISCRDKNKIKSKPISEVKKQRRKSNG